MGQKVNPISFRRTVDKKWSSIWYFSKKGFADNVVEDEQIRRYLKKKPCCLGASKIIIKRMNGRIQVIIYSARPGLVIGKKGAEIENLKAELKHLTGKEVWIEVEEIKRPDLDATLVAEGIANQLERRVSFRKAMKKAIQSSLDAGAAGIKVEVSGRIGGAEIARSERYKEGKIPLHTLRADIDYGTARAETTYGCLGVKVWVNRGENFDMK